jgi:hypothetical protein
MDDRSIAEEIVLKRLAKICFLWGLICDDKIQDTCGKELEVILSKDIEPYEAIMELVNSIENEEIKNKLRKRIINIGSDFVISQDSLDIFVYTGIAVVDISKDIAIIKASLGINPSELCVYFDITKVELYKYIKCGYTETEDKSLFRKIKRLLDISKLWNSVDKFPAKMYYKKAIDILIDKNLTNEDIVRILSSFIKKEKQKSNLEQLLEKQGIDMSTLPSQDEQFDLITGKSNFFGDLESE